MKFVTLAIQIVCIFLIGSLDTRLVRAQGLIVSAAGPVNRSMGGASTAAPLDALGAIYWNPATISGLAKSQTDFGLDLLIANHRITSSAGAVSGSTDGEAGVFPIPNVGWVHKTAHPSITCGLGVNAVAGFKTNLPSDPTNPALAPPPTGLGRVSSEASFLQLAPVVSVAVRDNLSIAGGPTITTGQIGFEPFVFDSANTNGRYASGRSTRYHWGGGFQVGAYYIHNDDVRAGVSFKSPTWMERFEFFGTDATGGPRILMANIDLPLIVSLGTSYAGFEDWIFALDVRYLDYANTNGLGDPAQFDGTGRLQGLDWSSVVAVALGSQWQFSDAISLRGGYTYNQNPVSNSEAFFNVGSPLIYQHMVSGGLSLATSESMSINVAYSYMLENNRRGPIYAPGVGAVAGTSFENSLDAHFLSFGISVSQ